MRIIDIKYSEIREQFIKMLDLVENQLDESFTIFINPDIDKARNIIHNEFKVDKYEYKLNKNCEKFLITCNPVADDLRNIMIINNMIPALKRISDITVKIARFIKKYENNSLPNDFIKQIELSDMLFHIKFMYKTVKESYLENTTLKLQDVFNRDKEVNKINKHAKKIITDIIDNSEISKKQLINLLLILTQLERVGDYIKSMGEEIYFGVEGVFLKHK